MRTELIYLWINKDTHGCFHREGFNFSPRYSVSYSPETRVLRIETLDTINVFKNSNIANVTAIIGENGTGKTTLLEYLTGLIDVPLSEETREEYQPWCRAQNELRKFIAVYIEDGNDEPHIINLTHDAIIYHGTEIAPHSVENFRYEDYQGQISHIYLSNGAYDRKRDQNMREGGIISYITITDPTLSTIFHDFYHREYGFPVNAGGIPNTPFNALAGMLAVQENSQSMQMFLDLLFYIYLSGNDRGFHGKHLSSISFSIKSTRKKIVDTPHPIGYATSYTEKKYIAEVNEKYQPIVQLIGGEAIWRTIVCNLVFELLFAFEDFTLEIPAEKQQSADDILGRCAAFIIGLPESREKVYYENALKEIAMIGGILQSAEIENNLLPQGDLGGEVFAKTNVSEFVPLTNHIKDGHSFILKYLNIQNFEISSGERALLNFMSRLYFASRITEFLPETGFSWNESILLLIDEIDLYLHPEWQRQILNDLFTAIQEEFPRNYFQIIITSHSPIILSDIPQENSIFLKRNEDGKIVQEKHGIQTFGANIYTLYKDAFFIKDGLAMGSFARKKINSWIEEIKEGEADADDIKKKLELIGEPIIRRRLEKNVQERGEHLVTRTMQQNERQCILEFLRTQKAAIQHQIDILEEYADD